MRFNFTGELICSMDGDKPSVRTGKTKKGAEYNSANLRLKLDQSCSAYLENFGMVQPTIKTMDTDNNHIEVSWDDRNDKDVVASIANYRKNTIKIGEDRTEFVSGYDFNNFLIDNMEELNGKIVTVTGQSEKNFYNGTVSDRFKIQNIYEVAPETKKQFKVTVEEYYQSTDIDATDWASEKKLYINGYTTQYISDEKANKFVQHQVVFDASKIDYSNERHVKLLNYKLKQMGLSEENGKIKINLKKNKVYKLMMICNYVNGAEEIDFDESQLTDNQKESIELGLKTLDDFKPKGQIFGNRVTIYKVVDFDLRGEYEDGVADSGLTTSEFEEEIYVETKEEKIEDIIPSSDEVFAELTDDDDDLFS